MLSGQRIGIVQFEFGNLWADAGSTLKNTMNLFEKNGYEVYIARKNGLFTLRYNIYGENFGVANFVAFSPKWHWVVDKLYKGVL